MTPARLGCLAQVASRVLDGLGVLGAQVDTGALGTRGRWRTAGQEAVAALADVLACAPAELVGAICWTDEGPKR
jgi:hypothetical protein